MMIMERSETRPRSHRRHGRHRHRHHHHHRHSRRIPNICKGRDANFFAAAGSMIVIVLLCTSLAEPRWFHTHGGGCMDGNGDKVQYIGMNELLSMGSFRDAAPPKQTNYTFGPKKSEMYLDCFTTHSVSVLHGVLGLCFVGMLFSAVAFVLDLAGPTNDVLKICQQFAIFNILTVLVCVVIDGLCFMGSELIYQFQKETQLHKGSKVSVDFSTSFYLITAAGAISIITAACNLLRKMPTSFHRPPPVEEEPLANDFDSLFQDDEDLLTDHTVPVETSGDPPPYSP